MAKRFINGDLVLPGSVGTVSQVGGVPTGAIVETGSNANGTFTKWADGTMICTYVGGNNTSGTYPQIHEWTTFPATFIDTPVLSVQATSWRGGDNSNYHYSPVSLAARNDIANGLGRCQVQTPTRDGGNAANSTRCRWIAIGRWF
jgi:hypothetical protein